MSTPPSSETSAVTSVPTVAGGGEPTQAPLESTLYAMPDVPTQQGSSMRSGMLVRLGRLIGLDRAIIFTVLARGWSALAGIGTLTLIARFLSPAEQGFYYTFYSLVAMQIVFELGFSTVILQAASHEAAHLSIAPDGTVTGPAREHSRFASVLQKAVRWYTLAALLMALTLIPVGIWFLSRAAHRTGNQNVHFLLPWLLVVLASSCTFQIDPLFSFLEGSGYVPQVARTRLRQSLLSTLLGWSAFLAHKGLFAPGMFILGQALAGGWFVFSKRRLLLPLLHRNTAGARMDWGKEIWPFQWRIAVSWLAGYITSQLFVPALMNFRGPVEAGQMGMSLNICGTLTTLAISWMNTKAAPFGQMIARKQYGLLDRVFFRTLIQSTLAAAVAFGLVWSAAYLLGTYDVHVHGAPLASRLLPAIPLLMLFLGTVGNVVVFGEALYLRAHKQEKFMVNSILGAIYIGPLTYLLARSPSSYGGAWGITAAYAAGTAVIGLGYGTYTFLRWRRTWHAV